ncbi:hypothetical protein [Streptomyces sp. NPDC002851]
MANLRKQVDMAHCIARIFEPLLRFFLPGPGRRRNAGKTGLAPTIGTPALPAPLTHRRPVLLTHGEEPPLLRPYVLTPAELRERRRTQRRRRRALWLAVHGVDLGPRRIHGVEVTA